MSDTLMYLLGVAAGTFAGYWWRKVIENAGDHDRLIVEHEELKKRLEEKS